MIERGHDAVALGSARHVVGVRPNARRGLPHHHGHVGDVEKRDVVLRVAEGEDARRRDTLLLRQRVEQRRSAPPLAGARKGELATATAGVVAGQLT